MSLQHVKQAFTAAYALNSLVTYDQFVVKQLHLLIGDQWMACISMSGSFQVVSKMDAMTFEQLVT